MRFGAEISFFSLPVCVIDRAIVLVLLEIAFGKLRINVCERQEGNRIV